MHTYINRYRNYCNWWHTRKKTRTVYRHLYSHICCGPMMKVLVVSAHYIHAMRTFLYLSLICLTKRSVAETAKRLIRCKIWGSHSGGYEEFHLLGYATVKSVENQPTCRRNMSLHTSGLKHKARKKPPWNRQQVGFLLEELFNPKTEVTCSSEK
jgi:hypothetical protein